ncbi:MAG: nascent polypeptide-associated complex protein [Sulfolobales archaeon]
MIPFTRDLEKQLRKLGVKVSNMENVKSIIIETEDKEIIVEPAQILVMEFRGQKIYQIIAEKESIIDLKQEKSEINEDDIRFIMEQTGLDREKARELLIKAGGDIAKALMMYQDEMSQKR